MKLHPLLLALSSCLVLHASAQNPDILPDPGTMRPYANNPGGTFLFEVKGSNRGICYGNIYYMLDSTLAVAAVHAGALRLGERGVISVQISPSPKKFPSVRSNGITSNAWDKFTITSFRISRTNIAPRKEEPTETVTDAVPAAKAPTNLAEFKADAGEMTFTLNGNKDAGEVWGTDVYTADSALAAAAVHAGVLKQGAEGRVKVRMMSGRPSYSGTARNGVMSKDYGPWEVAFEFVKP